MKKIKAEEIVLSNSFEELTEECLFATQGACASSTGGSIISGAHVLFGDLLIKF